MKFAVSTALLLLFGTSLAGPDLERPVLADGSRHHLAGQLIIELTPAARGHISIQELDGVARFGIPELDEVNRRWQVDEIAPLLRHPEPDPVALRYGCDLQYLVQFDAGQDIAPVAADYEALGIVDYACPNAWLPLQDEPDDSLYPNQWHLAKIGAPYAWDISHGDSSVLVAVLDDGCEWHHPDIEANLWINGPEDINGNGVFDSTPPPGGDLDGIDQDGNGYADDVIGYDVAGGDPNPAPFIYTDDHGTHCWGISNAVTDNGRGVAAPPWNCRSFGFRCGGLGGINLYAAISAIYYCVPEGAFVISMSFGGYSPFQPMADACQYAWDSGCVLVGGAGNDGTSNPFYPAEYPSVVSVAASGPSDLKTSWSNYGDWIEITAPGAGILSTVTEHGYGSKDGTSMATPLVAGVVAWIKSAFPSMSNAEVCSTMYRACAPMSNDTLYAQGKLGAGRVSMANVVLPLYYCDLKMTDWRFNDGSGNNNGRPDPGETAALVLTYFNTAGWQNATGVSATLTCPNPEVEIVKGTAGFPNIPAGSSGNCSNDSFVVRVPSSVPPQELQFDVTVTSTPEAAWPDTNFTVQSGEPRVLIVDDDLGEDYERWYTSACDSNGVLYSVFDVEAMGGSPCMDTLMKYPVVFWFTGMDSTTSLNPDDIEHLEQYLDAGNKLMLSGQNIAQQIQGDDFMSNYLHCQFVDNSTGKPFLVGAPGDPITDGDTMVCGGGGGANNGRSLDGVRATGGGIGCAFYKDYGDTTVHSVVRYMQTDGFGVVFFPVPFEAIDHSCSQYLQKWTLVKRILQWFGERVPGVAEGPPVVPEKRPYVLNISPNPFAHRAQVRFVAPVTGEVKLQTYTVNGRLVDSQARSVSLGERVTFELNGARLSNGVYLVQLVTPTGVFAEKTAVLK